MGWGGATPGGRRPFDPSGQACACVFEYLKERWRGGVRSLRSPKPREPEEKGFASSPPAAEMTATLWRVLLMWDLSG